MKGGDVHEAADNRPAHNATWGGASVTTPLGAEAERGAVEPTAEDLLREGHEQLDTFGVPANAHHQLNIAGRIEVLGRRMLAAESKLALALSIAEDLGAVESGWLPIDSAPKDVPVLTYRGAGLMAVAENIPDPKRWINDDGVPYIWCCTDGCELLNVTYWQPLPPAPTPGATT